MARKSKLNAGVIGLGIIGSRIADNLRKSGFQVYVWNRTPKPAPNFLASPAEVAGICDVVQIVVADSVALANIVDAMSGVLSARHTVICSATVGAKATLEAAQVVESKGAQFLDAPFTGSKAAAEKGELVYYIGGTGDAFRSAEPVLKASSKAIVKIGAAGEAATVKIATNMIAAVHIQSLVEACALLAKSEIDPAVLIKALEHHGARSSLGDMKLPKIVAGDYETHFSVKHMFKDVQLAIQSANRFDIDIPATTATAGALYNAISQGWADLDYAAVGKFYELRKPEPPAPVPPAAPAAQPVPSAAPLEETKPAEASGILESVQAPEAATPAEGAAPAKAPETPSDPPLPESPARPVENTPEASIAEAIPIASEPPAGEPVDKTPEAGPADKIKKVIPPPVKPQKSVSRWFGSGRKTL